ncbi:CheR family methyltransferase [Polycyclovorans algicola]|uniref:CheR family methyltransferase n=1 Tax=Polycyclovorans algicola TaxID=616992 RepID=UPI0004A6D6A7|nr:protein-glutamate O-methyltransferase CheR [Polycyclovorans algicola]
MSDDTGALQAAALERFIDAAKRRHGLDLSGYARASLQRRVQQMAERDGHADIDALSAAVEAGATQVDHLISSLSVPVTEMFRNPSVFSALREMVLPMLASWPHITIWQAGCATGEEVYSLAILLHEAGLYDRCQIFATDFNEAALAKAQDGIFPARDARMWSQNYQRAGGQASLGDYYHAAYDHIRLDARLKANIHFAHHNLVTDGVFCEAQLVLCRNVLIYFNRELQHQVLQRFRDSLVRGGYLCLGNRESIHTAPAARDLVAVDADARIYRLASS